MTAHRQQISAEMSAHYQRMEQRLDHDLSYICDSMRYLETYLGGIYQKNNWPVPLPSAHTRPLPSTGPPFPARTPSVPPPSSTTQRDPESDSDEQWPLLMMSKRGRDIWGVILLFMCYFGLLFFYMYLDTFCVMLCLWTCVMVFEVGMNLLSVWTLFYYVMAVMFSISMWHMWLVVYYAYCVYTYIDPIIYFGGTEVFLDGWR